MPKRIKDESLFRCPHCTCEYYDRNVKKGRSVGDPMVECPSCKKKSFRPLIMEPAIISGKRYYDIRFKTQHGGIRIGLILIYFAFLFAILATKSMVLSLILVAIAVLLMLLYELIKTIHMNSYLKTDEYESEVAHSLRRMADTSYARFVIEQQGLDESSVYYYALHENKEE